MCAMMQKLRVNRLPMWKRHYCLVGRWRQPGGKAGVQEFRSAGVQEFGVRNTIVLVVVLVLDLAAHGSGFTAHRSLFTVRSSPFGFRSSRGIGASICANLFYYEICGWV